MPETVQIYIDTHDIAKYAEKSDKAKIKAIFDSIPAQLNEKNRRFKLNSINASAMVYDPFLHAGKRAGKTDL